MTKIADIDIREDTRDHIIFDERTSQLYITYFCERITDRIDCNIVPAILDETYSCSIDHIISNEMYYRAITYLQMINSTTRIYTEDYNAKIYIDRRNRIFRLNGKELYIFDGTAWREANPMKHFVNDIFHIDDDKIYCRGLCDIGILDGTGEFKHVIKYDGKTGDFEKIVDIETYDNDRVVRLIHMMLNIRKYGRTIHLSTEGNLYVLEKDGALMRYEDKI